jgi:hypothetical protein
MAVDLLHRPLEVFGVGADQLALMRCVLHELGSPCEAAAERRFMLAILALARLAHIGPTTRAGRDKRPPVEYVVCRAQQPGKGPERAPRWSRRPRAPIPV